MNIIGKLFSAYAITSFFPCTVTLNVFVVNAMNRCYIEKDKIRYDTFHTHGKKDLTPYAVHADR